MFRIGHSSKSFLEPYIFSQLAFKICHPFNVSYHFTVIILHDQFLAMFLAITAFEILSTSGFQQPAPKPTDPPALATTRPSSRVPFLVGYAFSSGFWTPPSYIYTIMMARVPFLVGNANVRVFRLYKSKY